MKYNVYSVRDVLNGFGSPICDFNDKTAIRNFRSAFRNGSSVDPRDYDLFRIGSFDTDSGELIPETSMVLVFRGVDCIRDTEVNDA